MILVAGGTGLLGGKIVSELSAKNIPVRILTRNERNVHKLTGKNVEITIGDLCDPSSLPKSFEQIDTVISTANSFKGKDKSNIKTDRQGNKNLIDAAKKTGVKHFIYLSAFIPKGFKNIDFYRYQAETEEYLKNSGVNYTIIRHTFLMDVWAQLIGLPLIKKGVTTIIGKGNNPINFISAGDVAKITALVLDKQILFNKTLIAAGPENYSLRQVADIFEQVTGKKGSRRYVFLPALKVLAFFMRLYSPVISRQMRTAIYMDSANFLLDSKDTDNSIIKMTRLRDWVKLNYGRK